MMGEFVIGSGRKCEYWFNDDPFSEHVDIVFEYDSFQVINDVVQLCSIEELKLITSNIRERVPTNRPYSFCGEYFDIALNFGFCTVKLELPNQSYECCIKGDDLADIFERYVYRYEHLEDRFKNFRLSNAPSQSNMP